MSAAKKHGAQRTGRASLVRKFLARQGGPKSAREILDAVEPRGNISLMTATLNTLLRAGAVDKFGAGIGQVTWSIARQAVKPAKPAARRQVKKTIRPAAKAQKARAQARNPPAPKATAKIVAPSRIMTREQKTNFSAPLGTVTPAAKPVANRGRESVDDFLRRGGRIQVLKVGECSQPLLFEHSHYAEQRAKGRAAQQRIRAIKRA